jgi:hypothetical protein
MLRHPLIYFSEYDPYGLWEDSEEEFEQHIAAQLEKICNAPVAVFSTLDALMENRKELYEKYDWWSMSVADMKQYGAHQFEDGQYIKGWGKQANADYMHNYYHYHF